jgi:hypothetical protein
MDRKQKNTSMSTTLDYMRERFAQLDRLEERVAKLEMAAPVTDEDAREMRKALARVARQEGRRSEA